MSRLRNNDWRLYLHAQNLINIYIYIYIWQNHGDNTYLLTNLWKQYSRRRYWQHKRILQYKRGAEMHIADFLSRTFAGNKGKERKSCRIHY